MLSHKLRTAAAAAGGSYTPPSVVSSSYLKMATGNSITAPTGISSGNLLLAFWWNNAPNGNISFTSVPSGFTSIYSKGDTVTLQLYVKIATGSEPSSYTWSFTGATNHYQLLVNLTGNSLVGSSDGSGTPVSNTTNSFTFLAKGGFTTTHPGIVFAHCIDKENSAFPLSSTGVTDIRNQMDGTVGQYLGYIDASTPQTFSDRTFQRSANSTKEHQGLQVHIY